MNHCKIAFKILKELNRPIKLEIDKEGVTIMGTPGSIMEEMYDIYI